MKSPASLLVTVFVALVLLATMAPLLIELAHALLPLLIVVGVVVVVVRLVVFHTRNW